MTKGPMTALVASYICLVIGYVGICEFRAPTPWQACDSRWNFALGVLVPSPLSAAYRGLQQRKPGRKPSTPRRKPPPTP